MNNKKNDSFETINIEEIMNKRNNIVCKLAILA